MSPWTNISRRSFLRTSACVAVGAIAGRPALAQAAGGLQILEPMNGAVMHARLGREVPGGLEVEVSGRVRADGRPTDGSRGERRFVIPAFGLPLPSLVALARALSSSAREAGEVPRAPVPGGTLSLDELVSVYGVYGAAKKWADLGLSQFRSSILIHSTDPARRNFGIKALKRQICQQRGTRAQVQLLRVLDDGVVVALGSDSPRRVNIRMVSASNAELSEEVRRGALAFAREIERRLNRVRRVEAFSALTIYARARPGQDGAPADAGDFRLMGRNATRAFCEMNERNRYVRGMVGWIGMPSARVNYARDPRAAGETKYPLRKMIALAADGLFSFSLVPLRIAVWFGVFSALLGFAIGLWAFIQRMSGGDVIPGWASTMVAILFMGGVQLLTVGVMGEYIGRIYDEVRRRPLYLIGETVGELPTVTTAR